MRDCLAEWGKEERKGRDEPGRLLILLESLLFLKGVNKARLLRQALEDVFVGVDLALGKCEIRIEESSGEEDLVRLALLPRNVRIIERLSFLQQSASFLPVEMGADGSLKKLLKASSEEKREAVFRTCSACS